MASDDSPAGECAACRRAMTIREFQSHQNIHAKHQFPVEDGYVVMWRPKRKEAK